MIKRAMNMKLTIRWNAWSSFYENENKSPTKAEARHDQDAKWKIVEVFMCLV